MLRVEVPMGTGGGVLQDYFGSVVGRTVVEGRGVSTGRVLLK